MQTDRRGARPSEQLVADVSQVVAARSRNRRPGAEAAHLFLPLWRAEDGQAVGAIAESWRTTPPGDRFFITFNADRSDHYSRLVTDVLDATGGAVVLDSFDVVHDSATPWAVLGLFRLATGSTGQP